VLGPRHEQGLLCSCLVLHDDQGSQACDPNSEGI
jgi:hypothetical protein